MLLLREKKNNNSRRKTPPQCPGIYFSCKPTYFGNIFTILEITTRLQISIYYKLYIINRYIRNTTTKVKHLEPILNHKCLLGTYLP